MDHNSIYNSRNLYKVLNLDKYAKEYDIYNSRNLYKVLNAIIKQKTYLSTIVEIYIRY